MIGNSVVFHDIGQKLWRALYGDWLSQASAASAALETGIFVPMYSWAMVVKGTDRGFRGPDGYLADGQFGVGGEFLREVFNYSKLSTGVLNSSYAPGGRCGAVLAVSRKIAKMRKTLHWGFAHLSHRIGIFARRAV
jgi:hypothetical protein